MRLGARGAPFGGPHPRVVTPAADPGLSSVPDGRRSTRAPGIKRELGEPIELRDQTLDSTEKKIRLESKTEVLLVISRNPALPQDLPTPQGHPVTFKPH